MRNVRVIGGAVTKFGKHLDRNMKSLVAEAVSGALDMLIICVGVRKMLLSIWPAQPRAMCEHELLRI